MIRPAHSCVATHKLYRGRPLLDNEFSSMSLAEGEDSLVFFGQTQGGENERTLFS
jgi:hypothetical protein